MHQKTREVILRKGDLVMTEPIKPMNLINYGGVEFNSNDVAKKQKVFNEQGGVRYSVFLKNGVYLEYPEQKQSNKSSIFVDHQAETELTNWIQVNNLAYGQVKGTEEKDEVIVLNGNNSTTVDISDKNKKRHDQVIIQDTYDDCYYGNKHEVSNKFTPSKNNTVITDENDFIIIETQNTSVDIKGEGITTEKSLKDVKLN